MGTPIRIIASAALLTLCACADLATEAARPPAALRIVQQNVLTTEGEGLTLEVTLLDEAGDPIDIPGWSAPIWNVSANGVLAVEGSTVTALRSGQGTASATVGGMRASTRIRVNPRELQLQVADVYLVQSVQRRTDPVPLVRGRDALLRVFLTGDRPNFFRPSVRAEIYHGPVLAHTLTLAPSGDSISSRVREGSLRDSWNALIPGSLVEPGMSVVVVADPAGVVPLATGSSTRFPTAGVLPVDVREVPPLWLRLVPVNLARTGTIGNISPANREDWVRPTYAKYPVHRVEADIRTPYTTDADLSTQNGWVQLLREIDALRDIDGSRRYYYGVFQKPAGTNWAGVGYLGWPAAIGYDADVRGWETMAHELGHNFDLPHAPCGGPANPDPAFPYYDGSIGVFGYDILTGSLKTPADHKDLMTYCSPEWISDYNYEKVFGFREQRDWTTSGPDEADREPALLVWGGVQDGRIVLEPAFEIEMKPDVPGGDGPYRVTGFDAAGARLFSFGFAAPRVDHSDSRNFSFAIPSRLARVDRLARLEVTGPEGRAERRRSAGAGGPTPAASTEGDETSVTWAHDGFPMALVRDAATGEVLSFARGGLARVRTNGRAVDVLVSDGVRTVREPRPQIR